MGATHLNISAMLGAFYIGKNATSYFRTYMASEKMCRSIRGHAFFGAWLWLRTFLLSKNIHSFEEGKKNDNSKFLYA